MQPNHSPDIIVVGSNMMDMITKIPHLPKMGETLIGSSFHMGFGGKGANQAVMAARLGGQVGMVCKVGSDIYGQMVRDNFAQQGISSDYVFTAEGMSSGVAPILVDDLGQNLVLIVPGANMELTAGEVRQASGVIQSARILISQLEIPDEAILEGFKIARQAGVTTILNPAPARPVPEEILRHTDILAPNETEAEILTGIPLHGLEDAEKVARQLISLGAELVILTLGSQGAFYWDGQRGNHFPAPQVSAVDSTGAGDAFIGSLAFALASGQAMDQAIPFANLAAALSVTRIGTQVSFPTQVEIAAFQSRHHL